MLSLLHKIHDPEPGNQTVRKTVEIIRISHNVLHWVSHIFAIIRSRPQQHGSNYIYVRNKGKYERVIKKVQKMNFVI